MPSRREEALPSVTVAAEGVPMLSSDLLDIAGDSGKRTGVASAAAGRQGYWSGPVSWWPGVAWAAC